MIDEGFTCEQFWELVPQSIVCLICAADELGKRDEMEAKAVEIANRLFPV